jgi:Flp pilus assembly protein TadD
MKRTFAVTFLVGSGIALSGCQSPSLGGLAIWNRNNSSIAGSTAPDVGRQKFSGLSQQLAADQQRPVGQAQSGTAPLGGAKPAANDGFLMASWKKTTAAMTGSATTKAKLPAVEDDPLRLDRVPKKIGAEVYVGAARLLENNGNFPEAEGKYREALRAAPNDLSALVGLARLYDRQGESQKAIDAYLKAAQAHPGEGIVFNDLGLCYRRQRQLDKSLSAFHKAIELQPDNAKYRNNLAAALVDAGRTEEAYQELAAVNSPAVAHFNVAYLLQQKGLRADATRHVQEALRLDPALAPAQDMLAKLGGNTAPAAATATQPAPRMTSPSKEEVVAPYASGAGEGNVYTSTPQVESPAAALPPPSYHVGDDAPSAVETAQRTNWGSAAWALPPVDSKGGNRPLPPVD